MENFEMKTGNFIKIRIGQHGMGGGHLIYLLIQICFKGYCIIVVHIVQLEVFP